MRAGTMLTLLLLVAVPVWSQVGSQPDYGGNATSGSVMIAPPPVSGQAYPDEVGSEERSNYLAGGIAVGGGYIRNLFIGGGTTPTNESSYSILPNISLDRATPRQHLTLKYYPRFSFYEPTSSLNETDHSLEATYRLHVMPHVIVSVNNNFQKMAIIYALPAVAGGVSASPPSTATGAIPPLAGLTSNTVQGVVNWQYAKYAMVGGSGTFLTMRLGSRSRGGGLLDSNSRGGSGFWARRLSRSQYLGAVYQYFDILANPSKPLSETQTHAVYAFFTQYLTGQFSVSVSAGPQHFQVDQPSVQSFQSWTPTVIASLSWQARHTSLSASFDRTVTSGGGMQGAYHSYGANASARWQMTSTWTTSVSSSYASNKSVFTKTQTASSFSSNNGHTISGGLSIDHSLTEHLFVRGEYERIHQSYRTIEAIFSAPNSDRATVSLAWRFTRLLGR